MPADRLIVEKRGAVLFVALNRPEVRNAFDEESISAVRAAFAAAADDGDLRAVVVSGNGKDFCAGADIHWMKRAGAYSPAQNRKDAGRLVDMCRAIDECPAPVIVRLHGACFGGALGIAAAADIAVCSQDALMAFSECRLGIVPAVVSSFVIPKIGVSQARRYFLTAETFGAQAALGMGLVHEVAPEAELDGRVGKLVDWILRAGPQAVREAKAMIRKVQGLSIDKKADVTTRLLAKLRAGTEAKEGLTAFLEKRPAAWVPPPQGQKVQ